MEISKLSGELPDDIADFRLYGVFKEATRLLQKHSNVFLCLTGVFYIPYLLLNFLIFFSLRPSTGSFVQQLLSGDLANFLDVLFSAPIPELQLIVLAFVLRLLSIALILYLIAAIAYTVGSIYSTGEPSLHSVFQQLPKLWPKVAVTFLWSSFILVVFEVVSAAIIIFVYNLFKDLGISMAAYFAGYLICIVASAVLYVCILWLLASVVAVLEQTSGKDALIRSSALIVGKKCVAFGFIIIFHILGVVAGAVLQAWIIGYEFECIIVKVLVVLVFVLSAGILALYAEVMASVLYFSSKAYHDNKPSNAFIEGYTLLSVR